MITYTYVTKGRQPHVVVWLDGKKVGKIENSPEGWRYTPKGSNTSKWHGDPFPTLEACKKSL